MFYTVSDALTIDFFQARYLPQFGSQKFIPPRKISKFVKIPLFDGIAPKLAFSWHTWYLHEELIPLVLFSPMIQEYEKESMRHHFYQFDYAEVTKRIGLLYGKPNMKSVPPEKKTQKII